jgi:HSP20 family protein
MNKQLQPHTKREIEKSNGEPTRAGAFYVPHVDISEDENAITLRADLPGAKRDRVSIDVDGGVLTLTAEVEPPPSNWQLLYREYEVGGFTRRFTLGERIDQGKIAATFQDGVLTLVLPKAEAHKPRKIAVS